MMHQIYYRTNGKPGYNLKGELLPKERKRRKIKRKMARKSRRRNKT